MYQFNLTLYGRVIGRASRTKVLDIAAKTSARRVGVEFQGRDRRKEPLAMELHGLFGFDTANAMLETLRQGGWQIVFWRDFEEPDAIRSRWDFHVRVVAVLSIAVCVSFWKLGDTDLAVFFLLVPPIFTVLFRLWRFSR